MIYFYFPKASAICCVTFPSNSKVFHLVLKESEQREWRGVLEKWGSSILNVMLLSDM